MDKFAALLVDGSNMYASLKELGYAADYKKLLSAFPDEIHKAYYFTAMTPQSEQSTIRPMVDWLEYNLWTVIQKETKEFATQQTFECSSCSTSNVISGRKTKGNMDIEIATIAFEMAPHCHTLYLLSGDGDFRFMVEALQRRYGIKVVVVSTIVSRPSMCADNLRRQADVFIDLADLRDTIGRKDGENVPNRKYFLRPRT